MSIRVLCEKNRTSRLHPLSSHFLESTASMLAFSLAETLKLL
jgi:hypothetical protein